ncbi:cation:proton antiporter [Chloroflexota bacterium]
MSHFLQLAFLISTILLVSKTAGYLSIRLGQPAVLGELLAGILLGPSLLNLLNLPFIEHELGKTITEFAEIGVLLLMFMAGLELHFEEMRKTLRVAALAGLMGVAFPILLGWGTGYLFGLDQNASIFLGLTLGATSVSISAQTLMELKVLRSRVGLSLLGAAVFDDVLIILLLSIFLAIQSGTGGAVSVLLTILSMLAFLAASVVFGLMALPWIMRKISVLPISKGALAIALVIMFTYGIAAEVFGGMAAITGAFIAGLMLARTPEKDRLETDVRSLAYAFFVPIFFVNIGLTINLNEFEMGSAILAIVIIVGAVAGKWIGSGWGAKLGGLNTTEAVQLGAGMISRGEVGLIVASVGVQQGLVSDNEFSAIIVMILATTLITPPILRWLFAREKDKARKNQTELELESETKHAEEA